MTISEFGITFLGMKPTAQLTTLRALLTFGALRTSDEIAVAHRGIRSRSRRGYSRALRTLLASGTLKPGQAAYVSILLAHEAWQ